MDLCDFHTHILPNADHGSESIETSLGQLDLAKKFGVTRIFATPHFYPHSDTVDRFLSRRERSYFKLRDAMTSDMPDIRLGAEVLLCPNMDRLPGIEQLCVYGTNTLLLELPFNDYGNSYVYTVENLVRAGFKIVLAHAELYPFEHIEEMLQLGVKIQVNAPAVTPIFGNPKVNHWKKYKKLVALGSDIHGVDKNAYKQFALARKKLGAYSEYMCSFCDELWNSSKEYIKG